MAEPHLRERDAYAAFGLDDAAIHRLAVFAGLLTTSPVNVTAVRDIPGIERHHFLDCLALLDLPEIHTASQLVDIGSGAGLPAVVLAIARPDLEIVAVESVAKKCAFIERAALSLGLDNVRVVCARAEEVGRSADRETFEVAVSRALAALPVVAELSVPLLRLGGAAVIMKGQLSVEERMSGERALGILGAPGLRAVHVQPFLEAENRWLYIALKTAQTPQAYPRRPGVPTKRPLGAP